METERHRRQMNVLIESLELEWRDRDDFYAGGDMFVYFSVDQVRHNDFRGPDFFVVLDTTRRERKSWVAWQEDGRLPDVVVELTSPSTEQVDRGKKKDVYARQMRVSVYVIFDPMTGATEAYLLDRKTRRYRPLRPGADGRIEVEPLELFLGLHPTRVGTVDAPLLRWFDREGRLLPLPSELAEAETQRAESEAQRAESEAQRAESEKQRAEAEKQRAETEKQRAETEKQRADDLAARLAEYERRFGPTGGG